MLRSYRVCGYCFKNLERGSRCTCLAGQNHPTIIATRYTESLDMDLNESPPSIVGQDEWELEPEKMAVPGSFVGAKVVLSPEVQLCEKCQGEFQQACDWIAEIINRCMSDHVNETLIGSDSKEKE